jgi:L-ascorbate metabolism protein UlaG (beta-lactamase superfamily)
MTPNLRRLRNFAMVLLALLVFVIYIIWRQWQIRGSIDDIDWPVSMIATERGSAVTATWLGVTTVLFDDGETQILIDGAFTRINPMQFALLQTVRSDIATINYALSNFRMNRLAAIVPVHSHFDHAMDIGHVTNRTSAVILGSESTANIARGAQVPVDQYQILADGETRQFGEFTIKLIASIHAPVGFNNEEFFTGIIAQPLAQPARISAWKTGVAWSIIIGHPRGTTLVQGSSGFIENKLTTETVDVAMLSLAGLADLGETYTRTFWAETVEAVGATRIIAIHHDDFTSPFGEVNLLPTMLDNVVKTSMWLDQIVQENDAAITLELPPFGQPILLY